MLPKVDKDHDDYFEFHTNIIKGYVTLKKHQEALDEAEELITVSGDVCGFGWKAKVLGKMQRYEEAIKIHVAMTQREDADPDFANEKIAKLYVKQEKWDKAIEYCETLLKTDPENITALLTKAGVLEEQKKFEEAIKMYEDLNSGRYDDKVNV